MSEIQECSSVGCVSVDNITNNNENDLSKVITPLEETRNKIVDKDPVKVQEDITKLNETTISNASNISNKDDLILKSISDAVAVKDESYEVSKDKNELICKLEVEVKERTIERDMYQRKLAEVEQKLTDLETSISMTIKSADNNENVPHVHMTELKNKLTETIMQLEDRGVIVANQEKQINALNVQVSTLKEVVAITRDLLQIRNTEVKHLQAEVDNMEARIAEEREKHNMMMSRMDDAVRLNSDLKKEYETQLNLFKDLRIKYDEKINLLSEEKRALELANQSTNN
ncbi:tropomyosin-like [Vespa velutina]|uniref:tropomyosin-like n=1 Tax=Vespa velutina TaxID=202808 RepID=UPI001FB38EE1|nr:tropomyosin-like [Vespa velutina]